MGRVDVSLIYMDVNLGLFGFNDIGLDHFTKSKALALCS